MYFDIVIVGNSAAGLSAVNTLRRYNQYSSIALFDREDCPAYSRVSLPYYIVGKASRDKLFIVDPAFYERMGVNAFLGQEVAEINPLKKEIRTLQGLKCSYGKLFLGIGGESKKTGLEQEKAERLRHLKDGDAIHSGIAEAKSVTGLGAGLVTVPLLSHLKEEMEKNLVISSDRILSRVVEREASFLLEEEMAKKGVRLFKKDDVTKITANGKLTLHLKSGNTILTDFLIIGKGVEPNIELAQKAGIEVDQGIIVDEKMRTSAEDVYAGGDCAQGKDFITGKPVIQGNWFTAVEQGEAAAKSMLGLDFQYEGSLKHNITYIFGKEVAVVGYNREDAPFSYSYYNSKTGLYRCVFLDEKERLIGATLIGETDESGIYYYLVKTRAKIPGGRLNRTLNYAKILRALDFK